MPDTITFTACKHLDFGDDYAATKNLISDFGTTKVVWDRIAPGGAKMLCQFCKMRGRINYATGCLSEKSARCSLYIGFKHIVPLSSVKLD